MSEIPSRLRAADPRRVARAVAGVIRLNEREQRFQRRVTLLSTIAPLVGLVFAAVQMWGWGLNMTDALIALSMYVFTALGVTVGFHRMFTHLSFDARRPVKLLFAIAGSMSVQGPIITWVATHRRHHAYSDDIGDPHSPHLSDKPGIKGVLSGLWHAHIGWLTDPEYTSPERWAPDLLEDATIVKIDSWFPRLTITTFVLPAVLGLVLTQSLWGAVTAFVWGSLVRIFLFHHVTWSINSICHFYGTKPFAAHDESRNNFAMALLSMGEGWHNAHHAFPTSARHGLRWWEFDASWIVIRFLELVRLARNVKLPSPMQLARHARQSSA